jgi:hypothetical protein
MPKSVAAIHRFRWITRAEICVNLNDHFRASNSHVEAVPQVLLRRESLVNPAINVPYSTKSVLAA